MKIRLNKILLSGLIAGCCLLHLSFAQTITGAWHGKLNNQRVELKLIKSGDSLLGTSYYYQNTGNYLRYRVKGYFDPQTNQVIWWDDELLENHSKGNPGDEAGQLSVADFNCPGEDELKLDGSSNQKSDRESDRRPLHLVKTQTALFRDEWDYVLENYFVGTNDPVVIDSIDRLRRVRAFPTEEATDVAKEEVGEQVKPVAGPVRRVPEPERSPVPAEAKAVTKVQSNLEKFRTRKKLLQTVIPITADSVEFRFYDNAEIDGDSIAVYLNGRLLAEHVYLTDKPYKIHVAVNELAADNELVMVAENLGSIPPNTSYMVAIVGDKRYEARLFADEHSSALVRLVRPGKGEAP